MRLHFASDPLALEAANRQARERAAAGDLLDAAELAAIFHLRRSRFQLLRSQGAYDAFKVTPAISQKCYSGVLVHRYLQGEAITRPVLARPRRSA